MIDLVVKFENEADKESFISSVISSFNASGKMKSVHANTVERVDNVLFFTRQDLPEGETQEISEVEILDSGILEPESFKQLGAETGRMQSEVPNVTLGPSAAEVAAAFKKASEVVEVN
jgi:hypothetical protein